MRIIVAQRNFTAGAVTDNTRIILEVIRQAREALHADIVLFPELSLCGYLPQDRLLRTDFREEVRCAFETIRRHTHSIGVVLGHPDYAGGACFNAASLMVDGKRIASYHKQRLVNGGVFEEPRWFAAGTQSCIVDFQGVPFALLICEDLWHPEPIAAAKAHGAKCVLALNAAPFEQGKPAVRRAILRRRVEETGLPIIGVYNVGGQDELIFDGGSLAMATGGGVCAQAPAFEETLLTVELDASGNTLQPQPQNLPPPLEDKAQLWQALVLSIRDYAHKHGFKRALLGLSGGIDSALVLALVVDALGPNGVQAVLLPSRYTSPLSATLAEALCARLGVPHAAYPIEPAFRGALSSLRFDPDHPPTGTMAENLQARCRGMLLMAVSNQSGALLLNTSNKSELAVGYGTLYGDLVGGFAPLKDVYKSQVYALAGYRNSLDPEAPVFSEALLARPPTAELKPDQRDGDLLPPYPTLDAILHAYLEQGHSAEEIAALGFEAATVRQVIEWVNRSEFKRRQSPPGPHVSRCSLGRERRWPLT